MTSRKIIALFVGLEIIIIIIAWVLEGFSISALQTVTRFSGRLSLFLFSAIFLFYNRSTITAWLSDKFYLLFAVVHGIHLIELLLFVSMSGIKLIPIRVAGGFMAYVYIFLMPLLQS
jgi:ammonia channel protein AmtB